MIVRSGRHLDVLDISVTGKRPEKVIRQRRVPRGRIDAGGEETRPIRNRIQTAALKKVASHVAHIGDVENRSEPEVPLNTQAPVVYRRRIEVALDGCDNGRADAKRAAEQFCDRSVGRSAGNRQRRQLAVYQYLVVVEPVIKYARAAANGRLAIAENVPGKSE